MLYNAKKVAQTTVACLSHDPNISVQLVVQSIDVFLSKHQQLHLRPAVYREITTLLQSYISANQCIVYTSDTYYQSWFTREQLNRILKTPLESEPEYRKSDTITGCIVEYKWKRIDITLESALKQLRSTLLSASNFN